jgi:hypothetical protein
MARESERRRSRAIQDVKSLIPILLVAPLALPVPQTGATARDGAPTLLQANSLIDGLLKIAGRFQLPLAVEWVKSPDTLKPVHFFQSFTTANEAITAVLSSHTDYGWQVENGIVHVFPKMMLRDPRNPLNFIISQVPDRSWTLRDADNFLFQSIGEAVRSAGPKVLGVSSPAGSEPQFHLAASNARVREVLNQIITASKMKIWITTFPGNLPLTVKGYWETAPMYDPRGVKPEDQPFWIFLRWGDTPWKRLESPDL